MAIPRFDSRLLVPVFALLLSAGCGGGPDDYQGNPLNGVYWDNGDGSGDGSADPGAPGVSAGFAHGVTQDPLAGLGQNAPPGGLAHVPTDWAVDPCKVLKSKANVKPQNGKNMLGQTVFIGTDGDDIIFGTDGADFIDAKGGNDIICAGAGEDTIYGDAGNDYIDGGAGIDTIYAGGGNDIVHGRGGSDTIHGGKGNDYLNGDLLDDTIYGDEGNDVLIGGHGSDHMHGGPGDDYLRGDTGHDEFVGGEGTDTASFATAMPPGQTSTPGVDGIDVDLNPTHNVKLKVLGDKYAMVGFASGDGVDEPMLGIEVVVGSPYNDNFVGPPGTSLYGGLGFDTCNGAACDTPDEVNQPSGVYVFVDPSNMDPGLIIDGTIFDDEITIDVTKTGVRITANGPVQTGAYCDLVSSSDHHIAECKVPGDLFYLAAWGDSGNDTITIHDGLGRNLTTHVNGGDDDDVLSGSSGEDVFFTGLTGKDHLMGNGGDDALLSESSGADQALPGDQYGGGPDILDGGPGDDQLVSDYPCGGHKFIGGPGWDIAGFARVGKTQRIRAQLGGPAAQHGDFWGHAMSPDRCTMAQTNLFTTLVPGLEVLEGGELDDQLFGDDENNVIWGRGGNDEIRGYGGNDWLDGHSGDDKIYGGDGKDWMHGGEGNDELYAKDGQKDGEVNCGGGGNDVAVVDPEDKAQGCN
jgi:Ca2+-binding RTX toxin-like protein